MEPRQAFLNLPEARRNEVIAAIVRLFAAQPYEQVTMRMLGETLGVNVNTLYRWFGSKDEMFVYVNEVLYRRLPPIDPDTWDLRDYAPVTYSTGDFLDPAE